MQTGALVFRQTHRGCELAQVILEQKKQGGLRRVSSEQDDYVFDRNGLGSSPTGGADFFCQLFLC